MNRLTGEIGQRIGDARVALGLGLAMGVLVTGCSAESPEHMPDQHPVTQTTEQAISTSGPTPTIEQAPIPTNAQVLANPDLAKNVYSTLPMPIRVAEKAAVEIDASATQPIDYYSKNTGQLLYSGGKFVTRPGSKTGALAGASGSGSVVESKGKKYVLTDGHVIITDADACGETTVNYQPQTPDQKIGETAVRQAFNYGGDSNGDVDSIHLPDMGLISTTDTLADRPTVSVVSPGTVLEPGQVVYSVNFEPPIGGEMRSPANRDSPVVLTGIYLGEDTKTGMGVVYERGQSFDKNGNPEVSQNGNAQTRKGASGGMELLPNGQEFGTMVGGSQQDENGNLLDPANDVAYELMALGFQHPNVDYHGIQYEPGDSIGYIGPVNQSKVDALAVQTQQAASCTVRPPQKVVLDK